MWQDQGPVCARQTSTFRLSYKWTLFTHGFFFFILIAFYLYELKPHWVNKNFAFSSIISRRCRMEDMHTFQSCRDGEAFRPTWKRSRVLDEEFGELPSEAGSYLTDGVSQIVCRIRPVAALQAFYHSITGKQRGTLTFLLVGLFI